MQADYQLLAAEYLRKQAKLLRAQFDGIYAAEDVEFVHRARVASRRLMAALEMFGDCFNCKHVKRWTKAICRIRSELSEARDKDVQIQLLHEILASLADKAALTGLARLLVDWEYNRQRLQHGVLAAVERLRRKRIIRQIRNQAKRAAAKAKRSESPERCREIFARSADEIITRLDQLLALEDCLKRPDDQQSHHAMRIAVKQLRYTLELVRPLYSDELDAFLESVKQLQTLLGEVHDCDVWDLQLAEFANAQRKQIKSHYGHAGPLARLTPGIEYLRRDRHERRTQCFQDLVRLWDDLRIRNVWDNLIKLVQSAAREPSVAKQAGEVERVPEPSGDGKKTAAMPADPTAEINGTGMKQGWPDVPAFYDATVGKSAKDCRRPQRPKPVTP
jgi:CHAD domain-containing protein